MPIKRGVFVSSRSLDLFSPGQRHPRIKGCVHACHRAQARSALRRTGGRRGPELSATKLDSDRFLFLSKYWTVQADSTLELGSLCRHARTTDS
jgi:hypothetical protein